LYLYITPVQLIVCNPKEGQSTFDVYGFSIYPGANVAVIESTLPGDIEIAGDSSGSYPDV